MKSGPVSNDHNQAWNGGLQSIKFTPIGTRTWLIKTYQKLEVYFKIILTNFSPVKNEFDKSRFLLPQKQILINILPWIFNFLLKSFSWLIYSPNKIKLTLNHNVKSLLNFWGLGDLKKIFSCDSMLHFVQNWLVTLVFLRVRGPTEKRTNVGLMPASTPLRAQVPYTKLTRNRMCVCTSNQRFLDACARMKRHQQPPHRIPCHLLKALEIMLCRFIASFRFTLTSQSAIIPHLKCRKLAAV